MLCVSTRTLYNRRPPHDKVPFRKLGSRLVFVKEEIQQMIDIEIVGLVNTGKRMSNKNVDLVNTGKARETQVKGGKTDDYIYVLKDLKDLFSYWNSLDNLIKHRELSDRIKKALKPKLEHYSIEEIKKTFDNYNFVIGSTDHYWTHKWPLVIFMQRENGFLAFVDEADPRANFLNSDLKKIYAEEEAHIKEMGGYVT